MGTLFKRSFETSDKDYRTRAWVAFACAVVVVLLSVKTTRDYPNLAFLMYCVAGMLILLSIVLALKGATRLQEDIARSRNA